MEPRLEKQIFMFYKSIYVWGPIVFTIVPKLVFMLFDAFHLRKGQVKGKEHINHNANIPILHY